MGAILATGGAVAGTAIGTAIFPRAGSAIGGAVGLIIGGVAGSISGSIMGEQNFDTLFVKQDDWTVDWFKEDENGDRVYFDDDGSFHWIWEDKE